MRTNSSLEMRLKIYLRRECCVWICRRGQTGINFGWVLSYRDSGNLVFKDREQHSTIEIPVCDVESCGAV
ncbi:MAG TPA: hypothetical protein VGP72_13810 [Planctomycetota bacterium]|jgi:hypothetical protein